jgi:glycosyltransferase involved in cell wall biosynthesis
MQYEINSEFLFRRSSDFPIVSVVVTTKNEEKNIANCLNSIKNQTYPAEKIEVIVVDNYSPDRTVEIAKQYTDKIYLKGPQRAAQLNYGVLLAKGKFVLYPDADMILSKRVIEECVNRCENELYDALYLPEEIVGNGFWISVRAFERSFYNGTCIDAVRFVRKNSFLEIEGFDEKIDFGADDWDFNRRIREVANVGIITSPVYHNEGKFNLRWYVGKKGKYSKTLDKYVAKWGRDDPEIKKQLGMRYRFFGVFTENAKWQKLLRHPLKSFGMYFLRLLVGIAYLRSRL